MFAALLVALALVPVQSDRFAVHRLVSDRNDPQLVNAWGLAATPTGPWWVANEARGSSTLYAANGHKQSLTVGVPGGPTGVVSNGGDGFIVRGGGRAAPARFLYACEDGKIRCWSPTVPHGWSAEAVVAIDASAKGVVFRGLALAGDRLYVTDFHNAHVFVYDRRWHRILRGAFVDRSIPAWYAPFGIAALGGHVFVTYAWRAPVNGNDAPAGGYVDEFDLDGRLVGRINAYARNGRGWTLAGRLPVAVPGVWGIAFGTGGMSGPRTTLFFAGGPHKWLGASEVGVHGVLGAIVPAKQ